MPDDYPAIRRGLDALADRIAALSPTEYERLVMNTLGHPPSTRPGILFSLALTVPRPAGATSATEDDLTERESIYPVLT